MNTSTFQNLFSKASRPSGYDERVNLSRRTFLGAAASAFASPLLPRLSKVLPRQIIVGAGDHRYEVIHDWLTPPDSIKWGDTHGITTDSHGNIYIAHTVHPSSVKPDAICVFDPQGKFIRSWGSEFKGGAHGLDLRKEGGEEFLYHCDINRNLVVKTTLGGEVVWSRGVPMESEVYEDDSRWKPTNVALLPEGDLFVGDGYGSSYVHRYDKNGRYKGLVIGPGREIGQVREPHGLWIDQRSGAPKLVVCDRANHRLQEFTLDGKPLGTVEAGMRRPCHIHYKGDLALVPDLDSVVHILDRNNNVVVSLCDGAPDDLRNAPREKFIPGKFVHPHAAAWINDRDIVVVEWVPIGRVTLLRKVD